MKKLILIMIIAASMLASCHFIGGKHVQGNSNIETQDREVPSFSSVEVSGAMKVNISQGDVKKVQIEADENLIQYIETRVEGDVLIIRTKNGFNLDPTGDMRVYVTAPTFKHIEVSGACDIVGQGKINNSEKMSMHVSGAGDIKMEVNAPSLDVEISGSGDASLKGETKDLDLDLSGAASAHCYQLLSENTRVVISGAGDAEVYASVKLDASVSGAGSVNYKGDATNVTKHVSGAASVNKKE